METVNVLIFLEEFCKASSIDRESIEEFVPAYVFNEHGGL